jgi:hypothetical protein
MANVLVGASYATLIACQVFGNQGGLHGGGAMGGLLAGCLVVSNTAHTDAGAIGAA